MDLSIRPSALQPAEGEPAAIANPSVLVQGSQGICPVWIGEALLGRAGECLRHPSLREPLGTRCMVVTDFNVARLHAAAALTGLERAGFHPRLITVPAGEGSKSMAEAGRLCEAFAAEGLTRRGFVVALGGGVIGDLAGFAAAVFQRGVPCVQVPTTVTAQIDSAYGGKTGVNTPSAKNQIGVFHSPVAVLADPGLLATLPGREFAEGCAEAIKHGAIADRDLLETLVKSANADGMHARLPAEMIRRNVAIKAGLVSEDEFERRGRRALLNFGHTIGHGIESAAGYGRYLHGEAVSLGMVAAARLSVLAAGLPVGDYRRLVQVLESFALPTRLATEARTEAILNSLRLDKKFEENQVRFVLITRLGDARLTAPGEITWDHLRAAVDSLRDPGSDPALRLG